MRMDFLNEQEFDLFAMNHEFKSYFQTSSYGQLMKKEGFEITYIGAKDSKGTIVAATLIIYQKLWGKYRYGYAPRGFLVNYGNYNELKFFSIEIKKFLRDKDFIYIKIDPPVILQHLNKKGQVIQNDGSVNIVLNNLRNLGYIHFGFNKNFENLKPRNVSILNLNKNLSVIFSQLDKSLRNKIRQSEKKGLVIQKGEAKDIELFYNFIKKKHAKRKLNYYYNFFELFNSKDMFDIYFAKIETHLYSQIANLYYKKFEIAQEKTDFKLKNPNSKNKMCLVKKKIELDKQLDIWKNNVIESTKLLRSHPNGIIIGVIGIVKYQKEVTTLISGFNAEYKRFNPNHFLKWKVIEEFARLDYAKCDLNAISIDFNKVNPYYGLTQFILDFNGDAIEYIGEFDLIVNGPIYKFMQQRSQLKKFLTRGDSKLK